MNKDYYKSISEILTNEDNINSIKNSKLGKLKPVNILFTVSCIIIFLTVFPISFYMSINELNKHIEELDEYAGYGYLSAVTYEDNMDEIILGLDLTHKNLDVVGKLEEFSKYDTTKLCIKIILIMVFVRLILYIILKAPKDKLLLLGIMLDVLVVMYYAPTQFDEIVKPVAREVKESITGVSARPTKNIEINRTLFDNLYKGYKKYPTLIYIEDELAEYNGINKGYYVIASYSSDPDLNEKTLSYDKIDDDYIIQQKEENDRKVEENRKRDNTEVYYND